MRRSCEVLLFCLLAAPLAASAPEPEQAPEGRPARRPREAGAKAAAAVPAASDEIRLKADRQETLEKGHFRATGFVDLQSGDIRIQSDVLDYYESDKPDGTKSRRLVAEGNVVFLRGDERLAGSHMEMDLDTNHAVMRDAVGYVEPGVFVEARRIERVDATTYRIQDGKFTSCAQPNPRWGFTASSATIQVDDKIKARNVLFRVKSLPTFYLPYLIYPIRQDQRATGLLFPHFGYSSLRGFNIGTGFFWAMGRSADQTFYVDRYSKVGNGFGHELRYVRDSPSRGSFRSYALQPPGGAALDYDLNWSAVQSLPHRFRANALVRQYSNLLFQQQFQENLNLATTRTKRSSLSLQGSLLGNSLQLAVDSTDTYFGDTTRTTRRLPSLRLSRSPRRIGRTGFVFGYEARSEYLGRDYAEEVLYHSRFDLAPELTRSFATTFLQVTPRLAPRYTFYGKTIDDDGYPLGPSRSRPFFEGSVEVTGPQFSRVFANKLGFYTDRVKHVIGPEVTWTYRTAVNDFDRIPTFDGYDQFLGTNQVSYALVQALYAKRPGAGGKPAPYQFLTWRLQQTYYVQISDNQNEFDPNYSSSFFGPGGVPAHKSPLQSRLRLRPSRELSATFDLEYDVNFKQLRSQSFSGSVQHRRVGLSGYWYRALQVARKVENRVVTRNTLRSQASLQVLPGRLVLDGSADYDFLTKTLIQSRARLKFDVQCCGFSVETIQYKLNQRDERVFRFSIELANIGSIGNFMGQDVARQGAGFQP